MNTTLTFLHVSTIFIIHFFLFFFSVHKISPSRITTYNDNEHLHIRDYVSKWINVLTVKLDGVKLPVCNKEDEKNQGHCHRLIIPSFFLVWMRSSPSASDSDHLVTHTRENTSNDDNHYLLSSSGASAFAKAIDVTAYYY